MDPNTTLKMLSFNPFIVNENINDNNQDPDLNFFNTKMSLLLLTQITYHQKILRVSLKIIAKTLSLLYV